ncbi:hypothetical protein [Streptomyces sp. NPDC001933]|uniref:hypothetical protein n=1 Tax=Streptomyces sp. NPDC001933 TaxID=3364626 RepID=UPI00369A38C5
MTTRRRKPISDFVDEEKPSAPTVPRAARITPVRVTLDLSPADHRALKRWCNITAAALELPQVPLAPVLRILGKQLLADQELAARVRAELEQAGGGMH